MTALAHTYGVGMCGNFTPLSLPTGTRPVACRSGLSRGTRDCRSIARAIRRSLTSGLRPSTPPAGGLLNLRNHITHYFGRPPMDSKFGPREYCFMWFG